MNMFRTRSLSARASTRSLWICGVLASLTLLTAPGVWAQTAPKDASATTEQAPPTPPEIQPIEATEISSRAESDRVVLRVIRKQADPVAVVDQVIAQIDSAEAEINSSAEQLSRLDFPSLSRRGLRNLELSWTNTSRTIAGWQEILVDRSTSLNQSRAQLATLLEPWTKTWDNQANVQLPAALSAQVAAIIKDIEAADQQIKGRLDRGLIQQTRLSQLLIEVNDVLDRIREADAYQRQRLLKIDAEPLWSVFISGDKETTDQLDDQTEDDLIGAAGAQVESEFSESLGSALASAGDYLAANTDRVAAHVLLFLILSALFFYTRSQLGNWYKADETPSSDALDLFRYPVATAAFIALLFTRAMYPGAPLALLDVSRGLLALPLVALLTAALDKRRRLGAYALIAVFVIDSITDSLTSTPLAGRLLQLFVAALGLLALLRAEFGTRSSVSKMRRTWDKASRLVIRAAAAALILSIIANFVGIVALAYLLTNATLGVLYVGLGIFVAALVARGLLEVLLRSPLTAGFRGLRQASDMIRKRFNGLLDIVAILLWLGAALKIFGVLDPIVDALGSLIGEDITFGNFAISIGDILAFVIALYLGVLVSRFLRFVLSQDVYPRLRLPRGVPSTINMMVNYGVITIAFLIALAAAGFELGRLAIVAGALSVGIGFGLQAIVNNFVAGLILAFERPIQVGDTIEVATLLGRVTHIGVRASTLRTYDGSEVIVPNSEFISGQVVNWTLSDVTKRQHVPIGVAYGSDPEQVINLLVEVAGKNPLVLPEPEPFVVFKGFGDSSLDFELRAWCAFNDGLAVLTQLNVAINRALAENGIEIPFPQRDLHLRSVDTDAGSALAGTGRRSFAAPESQASAAPDATAPPSDLPAFPAESDGSDSA